MQDLFPSQVALLEAACHRLHDRPDDPVTQEIVLRALAAFRPDPGDASPLIVGLTRMVWHYSEMLKYRLEQAKTGAARPEQLKRAATEVCRHLVELKEALVRDAK